MLDFLIGHLGIPLAHDLGDELEELVLVNDAVAIEVILVELLLGSLHLLQGQTRQ